MCSWMCSQLAFSSRTVIPSVPGEVLLTLIVAAVTSSSEIWSCHGSWAFGTTGASNGSSVRSSSSVTLSSSVSLSASAFAVFSHTIFPFMFSAQTIQTVNTQPLPQVLPANTPGSNEGIIKFLNMARCHDEDIDYVRL